MCLFVYIEKFVKLKKKILVFFLSNHLKYFYFLLKVLSLIFYIQHLNRVFLYNILNQYDLNLIKIYLIFFWLKIEKRWSENN